MKQFFVHLMAKWTTVILPAVLKMGLWGSLAAAVLDSSSIPVPMDFFIAGWVWNDQHRFWLYCLLASAGSAVGGLVPYLLGRAGGELFLLKRVNRERFEQLRLKFERQEFVALMVPSMLPPPTPWKVFVFAAGVFEMRVMPFLFAVFCGRMVRWLILSVLVLKLGPGAVDVVAHHARIAFGALIALALLALAWWWLRRKRSDTVEQP